MTRNLFVGIMLGVTCLTNAATSAQPVAMAALESSVAVSATALPDPLDPSIGLPAQAYKSSLSSYRRMTDEVPTDWVQMNESVAKIGGWRTYARESQGSAVPAHDPSLLSPTQIQPPSASQPPTESHGLAARP